MSKPQYLIGYDVGSSFVKASLLDIETGKQFASASSPDQEMKMSSKHAGWAEQEPETWWEQVKRVTHRLLKSADIEGRQIKAIGISYQMHGLVAVDRHQQVLRPSIIWCDSRAVETGKKAFEEIGPEMCLDHFLNSPGNFTASKLKWVQDHEPELYERIDKIMLPGDYIGMKMTGTVSTTISGLSEGILWDFKDEKKAQRLLNYFGISEELIPEARLSFDNHGELTESAAEELGLKKGTVVAYKAGDQPNNAFSLNVVKPGEVAATAGTSGVIYGVTDKRDYDKKSRVNTFVHVNHSPEEPRYGILMCLNGTGILNSWLKRNLNIDQNGWSYEEMNKLAAGVAAGADDLFVFPFGNGAERILENKDVGAQFRGLHFNRHRKEHLLRASQEGIVFALYYGFEIMQSMGLELKTVKAGYANMFLSPLFRETFANITGATLELYNTDGAQGAARGAGVGAGIYEHVDQAFAGIKNIDVIEPDSKKSHVLKEIYGKWLQELEQLLDV